MSERSSAASSTASNNQRALGIRPPAAAAAGAAGAASQAGATSGGSVRSASSSQRSSAAASGKSNNSGLGGGGSTRSITSSVAYEQIKALDGVLQKERQAREEAERTLQILMTEREDKDAATRRNERTEKQLQTLLQTLNKVLEHPGDVKRLQQLQRYALSGATSATPSERSLSSSNRSKNSTSNSNSNTSNNNAGSGNNNANNKNSAAALAAAGNAANNSKTASRSSTAENSAVGRSTLSFFDKFGRGDERQMKALDRSLAQNRPGASMAAAGAQSKTNAVGGVQPHHVPAIGNRGGVAEPRATFTHRKTDLM